MARGIAHTLRLWRITEVAARTDYFGLINLITPHSYACLTDYALARAHISLEGLIFITGDTHEVSLKVILCLLI